MTASGVLWLALLALFALFLSSLGARLIYEIGWHDLEDLCRRKNRRDRFDEIINSYEDVSLGMESLRHLAVLLLIGTLASWAQLSEQWQTATMAQILGMTLGGAIAVLFVGVWLPAAISRVWTASLLYHSWRILRIASFGMIPLSFVEVALEAMFRRMAADEEEQSDEEAFEDEIRTIVTEGIRDGHIEADAREMIESVIELRDADVADIMTPRSNVDLFSIDLPWGDILKFVADVGRTRIPVFDGDYDNVVGILYVKDLLAEIGRDGMPPQRSLREILRPVSTVPKARRLNQLLSDFLQTRNHLAIVVDEYSAFAGIVTIEDVLEEIVGEIVDEYDDEEHLDEIHRIDENTAEIHGRAHLADVNEQLGLDLPDTDDFDTIGGFVVSRLGRIPQANESLEIGNLRITIVAATKRKVDKVLLESLEPMSHQPVNDPSSAG
ncbi:MAG: hemolysin family protein [Pirellulaceae bacterium]|nr:HlyC/CorC family transporter [Planctomycetales bacterium]